MTLPSHLADDVDAIVDLLLDEIDKEPEDLRARLLASIRAGRYSTTRETTADGARVLARFPEEGITYEVRLVPRGRRFDA
jgi:hypothetical protein